jgi:PIN domain nuclease of toxin-antitoxin system
VILLDTPVVVWLAFAQEKISPRGSAAIRAARQNAQGLGISGVTLLELATLANQGRIRLGVSLESFLQEVEFRFAILPMNSRVCAQAVALPAAYPIDPADRIIGATALASGLPLITANRQIRSSRAVQTIW